jgi:hypothetical protein
MVLCLLLGSAHVSQLLAQLGAAGLQLIHLCTLGSQFALEVSGQGCKLPTQLSHNLVCGLQLGLGCLHGLQLLLHGACAKAHTQDSMQ